MLSNEIIAAADALPGQCMPAVKQHKNPATRALRRILSYPVMRAALLVFLAVFNVRESFNDPDMWWHLETGEIIWNTHSIPRVDTFSFTTNNHAYTPHEWLAQLTMYAAYRFGGYSGVMLWLCILASLFIVTSYALCALYSRNVKVAFAGGMVTWFFATVAMGIRPQMLGYLLLALELLILHLGRSWNSRWFLALPPLFALWVNCHSSFFWGVIVAGTVLICSYLNFRSGLLVSQCWERERSRMLAVAFALSIAALFVNPVGWKQVSYPLDVFLNQHVGLTLVSEWQPPQLTDPRAVALFTTAALILAAAWARRASLFTEELIPVALGFVLAVQHSRMLIVFGMLAAPVLCRLLAESWGRYKPDRDRPVLNTALMLASFVCIVLAFPNTKELQKQVEKSQPVQAVQFIERSGLSGRMLNHYDYGGYLIWAAPKHKVFVDGRADVFEWTGVLADYKRWTWLEEDPRLLLDKYRIDFCLLPRDLPISHVMPLLAGWKNVYSDRMSIIFARSKPAGR